ncbi:MAG: hypothetical protein J6Z79_02670 [Clostridia bacterium]|nr:hypothetical protein [Clostridia bacterium]
MTQQDLNSFALEYRLRKLDPPLHKRFTDGVFGLQRVLSNYKLIFPEFTDHSELHSLTVIDFCNRLIGDQLEKLNQDEIYVLLLGCYFHDTGMGISRKDFEAFSQKIDLKDYLARNPDVAPEKQIRDFHNEYSGLFIRKYAPFFEFPSEAHLEAIIQISRGHRKTDLKDESAYPMAMPVPNGNTICLPYLCALLRLADEIDVTAARNSILLFDPDLLKNEVCIAEHKRHRAIRDLLVEKDAFILVTDTEDEEMLQHIRELTEKMYQTLATCRDAVNGRTPYLITQKEIRIQRVGQTE